MDERDRAAPDRELHKLRDEELVVLATARGCQSAEAELLLRYQAWSDRLILRLARGLGLAPADIEDARQDAVFGVLKAIARYDPLELDKPQGCHFHTFLRRVLTDRFKDFIKRLWRIESHYRQPEPRATGLGGGERKGRSAAAGCDGHFVDRKSDPALIVEGNELRARLR